MLTAIIAVDGDQPTTVTINGVTTPVPVEPGDAPAARIIATIESMGYVKADSFRQSGPGAAEVGVALPPIADVV